jgi:hypothetical protein
MSECLDHAGDEREYIFLLEGLLAAGEVGLEVGDALFHLNIALLVGVDVPPLFLKNVGTPILDDIGMGILFDLREELNFFPEYKLSLFIVQPDLFDTFDVVLLISRLINNTIPRSDHVTDLEILV